MRQAVDKTKNPIDINWVCREMGVYFSYGALDRRVTPGGQELLIGRFESPNRPSCLTMRAKSHIFQ